LTTADSVSSLRPGTKALAPSMILYPLRAVAMKSSSPTRSREGGQSPSAIHNRQRPLQRGGHLAALASNVPPARSDCRRSTASPSWVLFSHAEGFATVGCETGSLHPSGGHA
jgi:hypothetical protein